MKIKECEVVFRYHVYFTKEESQLLRDVGFLHPMSKPETDMWWTEAELDDVLLMFPELAGAVDRALKEARDMMKKAREKWQTKANN